MSEQTTPRTVEEAAREAYPPSGDRRPIDDGRMRLREGFRRGAAWQAARMPSVADVAEVLAAHVACYGGSDEAYAVTCFCDRYGRPMGYAGLDGVQVHARHQAERVAALWGAL